MAVGGPWPGSRFTRVDKSTSYLGTAVNQYVDMYPQRFLMSETAFDAFDIDYSTPSRNIPPWRLSRAARLR